MIYLQINDFLKPDQVDFCNASIRFYQRKFTKGQTSDGDTKWRSAKVATLFPEVEKFFIPRLKSIFPRATRELCIKEKLDLKKLEAQVTISSHGDYYKRHDDAGSSRKVRRVLTYVYYLHNEPKLFGGGQLRLYFEEDNRETYTDIVPKNNTLVLFRSERSHEILPVWNSGDFDHARRTINGWVSSKQL